MIGDGLGFRGQHRGLVHHTDALQILQRIEVRRGPLAEDFCEPCDRLFTQDDPAQQLRFIHVLDDHRGRTGGGMAESGARFFVCGFAMDHHGVVLCTELRAAFPHLLHERASGVVLQRIDADGLQPSLRLQRGAEGGDDHDVVRSQFVPIHQHGAVGVLDEPQAVALQIGVHLRVVDHLAQQEDPFAGVLLDGLVADLDGVLHAVAEAEVPGEHEPHCTQVQQGGREVLLLRILCLAEGLQAADELAAVVGWDGE